MFFAGGIADLLRVAEQRWPLDAGGCVIWGRYRCVRLTCGLAAEGYLHQSRRNCLADN